MLYSAKVVSVQKEIKKKWLTSMRILGCQYGEEIFNVLKSDRILEHYFIEIVPT